MKWNKFYCLHYKWWLAIWQNHLFDCRSRW